MRVRPQMRDNTPASTEPQIPGKSLSLSYWVSYVVCLLTKPIDAISYRDSEGKACFFDAESGVGLSAGPCPQRADVHGNCNDETKRSLTKLE